MKIFDFDDVCVELLADELKARSAELKARLDRGEHVDDREIDALGARILELERMCEDDADAPPTIH